MSRFIFIATITFLTLSSFGQNARMDIVYASKHMRQARCYLIGLYPNSVDNMLAVDTAKLLPFFFKPDFITDTVLQDGRPLKIVPFKNSLFTDTTKYSNKTELYKSLCFKVYSPDDSSFILETQDGRIPAIIEAKNDKGEWKPIEFFVHSFCGNSNVNFLVPKQHYAFLKASYFIGDYKTTLRLKVKLGNNFYHSKEFDGTIAKAKFNVPKNMYDLEPCSDKTKAEIYSRMFLQD